MFKIIREFQDSNMEKYIIHKIRMNEYVSGGWHRQVIKFEGLLNRLQNRWHRDFYPKEKRIRKKIKWSQIKIDRETKAILNFERIMRDRCEKYGIDYVNDLVELRYYNSIEDFFEYINYDPKNKSVKQLDRFIMKKEL